ncbi:hypothetical protein F4808DRAFT_453854 [Astrocystis sublimbata]|nr:hypothetical protein F4808DRAFT_453854 [Astrocystis sublimbata]
MAVCLRPYTVANFNAAPLLPEALQKHSNAGGNNWVHHVFGPLFLKHRVQKLLGIGLRHAHFLLKDGEYLTEQLKINGVYCLVVYPGDDFPGRVEMTVGRANVNLTPAQAARHDPAQQSEAAWYFSEALTKRGCACNCFHHRTPQTSHTHVQTITK